MDVYSSYINIYSRNKNCYRLQKSQNEVKKLEIIKIHNE